MSYIGNNKIDKIFLGNNQINKVYFRDNLVYDNFSYVDWLKSIGCVVWLPLSKEGDLKDRISGESLQLSGNGSMTWVALENSYKIKTPNVQFQYVALLNNGLTKDRFPNNYFTTLSTFKKITSGDYSAGSQFAPLSTDDNTIVSMNPMYNVSINTSNFPNNAVKLGRIEADDGRYFYQEGDLYDTRAAAPTILPTNWVQTNGGLMVGFVRKNESYYKQKEYYIKDIYIFNTKLTLEQIRTIQGYPPYDSEIEYLESSGTQYINLGSNISAYDNIEAEVMFTDSLFQWFGAYDEAYNNLAFNSTYYNTTTLCFYCTNSSSSYINKVACPTNKKIIIKWFGTPYSAFECDGVTSSGTIGQSRRYKTNHNPYLFARNNKGAVSATGLKPFRVYSFKVEGKLDLIPVRIGQKGYLYNKIDKTLFDNIGTGSFILGPDVNK